MASVIVVHTGVGPGSGWLGRLKSPAGLAKPVRPNSTAGRAAGIGRDPSGPQALSR